MRYLPNTVNESDIENACDELKALVVAYLETGNDDDYAEAYQMCGYIGGLIDQIPSGNDDTELV